MAAQRTRVGLGHALACLAHGLAVGALLSEVLGRATTGTGSAAPTLALAVACAVAVGALAFASASRMLELVARRTEREALPQPGALARRLRIIAAVIATGAAAAAAALAMLDTEPHMLVVAALGLAGGLHAAAAHAEADAEPALAPRLRPAPTLLASAAGLALSAGADALPSQGHSAGWALVVAALLQLVVLALAIAVPAPQRAAADHETRYSTFDPAPSSAPESTSSSTHAAAPASAPGVEASRTAGALPALALLALAAAGVAALAALRPALSALGTDEPQAAGPLALTLALGALLGPPLAQLAGRFGGDAAPLAGRTPAVLATLAGGAALVAPIARPGALDWVAGAILGVALAASVALLELARRAGARPAPGTLALLLLVGAAGAGLAWLLLGAVPLPDVVLGAAIACLVAGIGTWVPRGAAAADGAVDTAAAGQCDG